jgi:cobalt-zinc-cadmium efflux system protein
VGHRHGAPAGHAGSVHGSRLRLAWLLTVAFLAVELTAALLTGSLALLSDAGHMGADVVALSASLLATRHATRPDGSGRKTYGNYRIEILAAAFTCLLMVGVGTYTLAAVVTRLGDTPEVASTPMLVVGLLGLAVNAVALLVLRPGAAESLNLRGAYLEVIADAAGSAGVVVAAVLIATTGTPVWDSVMATVIGVFVVVRGLRLGRQVWEVLGQYVPAGMDAAGVESDLAALPGVLDVHDLHLWTLTSGMDVATAHLVTAVGADQHGVLDRARDLLRSRYGLEHATLQVESEDHDGCEELSW